MFINHIYLIYMNKTDLAVNNLYWLKYHKSRGVMVIVVGNGLGDTSSNPGPG